MSKKSQYKYYVAVFSNGPNEILYVTKVDYKEKAWYANYCEPALPMKLYEAEDLVFGMTANFCPAFIAKVPDYLDLVNVKKESDDDDK